MADNAPDTTPLEVSTAEDNMTEHNTAEDGEAEDSAPEGQVHVEATSDPSGEAHPDDVSEVAATAEEDAQAATVEPTDAPEAPAAEPTGEPAAAEPEAETPVVEAEAPQPESEEVAAEAQRLQPETEEVAAEAQPPQPEAPAPEAPEAQPVQAEVETTAPDAPVETVAADTAAGAVPESAEEEEEEPPKPEVRKVEGSQWYILQTYSGFENRVKKTIEEKLRVASLEHQVEEVFVPGEDVTRIKNGRKRTQHVIYFPGYVLIKMNLSDELWHLLMDIPRVAGFVGGNNRDPQPLKEDELSHIRSQMSEGFRQATLKEEFEMGQQVIVIDGPFANFSGKIDEVNVEKNKLRVLISILGRSTPVELDFDKVKAHPDAG